MLGGLMEMEKVIELSTDQDWVRYKLVIEGDARKASEAGPNDKVMAGDQGRTIIEGGVGPNTDTYRIFGQINREKSQLSGVKVTDKKVISADYSSVIYGGGLLIFAAVVFRIING